MRCLTRTEQMNVNHGLEPPEAKRRRGCRLVADGMRGQKSDIRLLRSFLVDLEIKKQTLFNINKGAVSE